MKKVLIAPDSFKESLAAGEVAAAIAAGIKRVDEGVEIVSVPMSDGGEGLVQALVAATKGCLRKAVVTGSLGKPVEAFWGISGDGRTAVMEMAAASGLPLVPPAERNPWRTTTYGTGELIKNALDAGCQKLIVGIGGSATNEGGAGMAQALGVRLLTADGKEIGYGAEGLKSLARVDAEGLDPRVKDVQVVVAVDVDNPLCGPRGASFVYGPQKGAPGEMLGALDRMLAHYAQILKRDLGADIADIPGAGAAGGLGAGLAAFLAAELRSGVDVVLEAAGIEEIIRGGVELVITGEGEINEQTSFGKVPVGVARLAKKYGLPVWAFVGSIGKGAESVLKHGIDAYFSIAPRPLTLQESLQGAEIFLADLSEQCFRLLKSLNLRPKA